MAPTIHAIYFSPTHTTEQVVTAAAGAMRDKLGATLYIHDITLRFARRQKMTFSAEDVVVLGLPVHGGRIPAVCEDFLCSMKGAGTPAVAICVYGNRDFDDALLEMKDLLQAGGFTVFAAAAFIGEHSYSAKVAHDRPDYDDLDTAAVFGKTVAGKLAAAEDAACLPTDVPGSRPYRARTPAEPHAPKTNETCINCRFCAKICPMSAIDPLDVNKVDENLCLGCFSCVKFCPVHAKYFDDPTIRFVAEQLELLSPDRKEPHLFV